MIVDANAFKLFSKKMQIYEKRPKIHQLFGAIMYCDITVF